jgi:hypothetical protein
MKSPAPFTDSRQDRLRGFYMSWRLERMTEELLDFARARAGDTPVVSWGVLRLYF